jgi:2-phosphosulfolactate phosphatase
MYYSQHPYRCRLDWGRHGTRMAAERGDILVIVDTLSFSTAVATAVQHGGIIYPCSMQDQPAAIAQHIGGEAAVSRHEVPAKGRFSLSPATMQQATPGTRIVLASPNGATCSHYARQVPHLLVGTLINAQAVAQAVTTLLEQHNDLYVTVIACGERWTTPTEDGELRIAIEDYLGAGAILSYLPYELSPEAQLCAGAFMQAREQLKSLLWECGSGRELRAKGYGYDVDHAAQLNLYETVPLMQEDCLSAWKR